MDKKLQDHFGFEQLEACSLARKVIAGDYGVTSHFPKIEQFGLVNQLHRAATSIALNIAEGKRRNSGRNFRRFLCQARGSLLRAASAVQIGKLPAFLDTSENDGLLDKASKLKAKPNAPINALNVEQ